MSKMTGQCLHKVLQLRVEAREDLPVPVFMLPVSCAAAQEPAREETLQRATYQT